MGNHKGATPWNKGKTKITDSSVRKISTTMIAKKIDNFAEWRKKSKTSGIIQNTEQKLKKSLNLCFLIGLSLGDGNISKFPRVECLRITLGTDKPVLANYSVTVIKNVLGRLPSLIKRSNSNCYNVTIISEKLK